MRDEVSPVVVERVATRVEGRSRRRARFLFGLAALTALPPLGLFGIGAYVSALVFTAFPLLVGLWAAGYGRSRKHARNVAAAARARADLTWVHTPGRLEAYQGEVPHAELWLVDVPSIEHDRRAAFPAARVVRQLPASSTPPDTDR